MNQIIDALQQSLITIILAVITAGSALAITYINKLKIKAEKQISEISDKSTQQLAQNSLNTISELCETTVKSLEQEVASEIRKKLDSGDTSVSRDDLLKLKDTAIDTVKSQITTEISNSTKTIVSDLDSYIDNKISACLLDLKKNSENNLLVAESIECESEEPNIKLLNETK